MKEILFHISQKDENDCGVACIYMIFRYYGYLLDYNWLKTRAITSNKGVSLLKMRDIFNELNIKVDFYKPKNETFLLDNITIIDNELPAIAFMRTEKSNQYHYIVIYKIRNGYITYSDPNEVKVHKTKNLDFINRIVYFIKLDFSDFKFSTKTYIVKEKENFIVRCILKEKKYFIFISSLSLIISIIGIFLASKIGIIIDMLNISNKNFTFYVLMIFVILLSFLIVTNNFITLKKNLMSVICTKKIEYNINKNILDILINQYNIDLNSIKSGELMSRINDCVSLTSVMSSLVINFFPDVIIGFVSLVVLTMLNYKLSFLIIVSCIILLIVNLKVFSKMYDYNYNAIKDYSYYYGNLLEIVNGLEEVQTTKSQVYYNNKIIDDLKLYNNSSVITQKYSNIISINQNIFSMLICIIAVMLGVIEVLNGYMTLGNLTIFITISEILQAVIKEFISFQFNLENFIISYNRILQIFFDRGLNTLPSKEYDNSKNITCITLNEFSLSYLEKEVFNNVNVELSSKNILITGVSGSGKSSLAKCIAGLYTNYNGKINMYSNDINCKKECDNVNVVYLSNDSTLFAGTIRENITQGKKILNTTIHKLCDEFKLNDFINSLPMKLEQEIAPNQSNISTGQKQKIALIRSIVAEPDILILDEALSNIDIDNRNRIIVNLEKYSFMKIYISHDDLSVNNSVKYIIEDKKVIRLGEM